MNEQTESPKEVYDFFITSNESSLRSGDKFEEEGDD